MHYDAREQYQRFADVDEDRSRWILLTRWVRLHERAVFKSFEIGRGPVLELGAGEGLTLRFLPRLARLGYVGTDLHLSRARAIQQLATSDGLPASALSCDASALPFRDASFGTVLCRDMLHHLPLPVRQQAVREIARVLRPDGQLSLIEPNAARSPVVALFSALIPTERMALGFHSDSLQALLGPCFDDVKLDHIEPSMLYRLVLHYRFGRPELTERRRVVRLLHAWERTAERLVPPRFWTYLRARCRTPHRP